MYASPTCGHRRLRHGRDLREPSACVSSLQTLRPGRCATARARRRQLGEPRVHGQRLRRADGDPHLHVVRRVSARLEPHRDRSLREQQRRIVPAADRRRHRRGRRARYPDGRVVPAAGDVDSPTVHERVFVVGVRRLASALGRCTGQRPEELARRRSRAGDRRDPYLRAQRVAHRDRNAAHAFAGGARGSRSRVSNVLARRSAPRGRPATASARASTQAATTRQQTELQKRRVRRQADVRADIAASSHPGPSESR